MHLLWNYYVITKVHFAPQTSPPNGLALDILLNLLHISFSFSGLDMVNVA